MRLSGGTEGSQVAGQCQRTIATPSYPPGHPSFLALPASWNCLGPWFPPPSKEGGNLCLFNSPPEAKARMQGDVKEEWERAVT